MDYLKNSWYCAGWASNLTDKPVGLTLLEKPVVFFRDAQGEPAALDGRCPHRFAPLWKGQVSGDTLTCPYHGLVFNKAGACIHNPHGDGHIPPNARLGRYPVAERNNALWIWMGDPASADSSML